MKGGDKLTLVVACGQHSLICGAGAHVPYLTSVVQEDILINHVILIIKVNDVNLRMRGEHTAEERVLTVDQRASLTDIYFNITINDLSNAY